MRMIEIRHHQYCMFSTLQQFILLVVPLMQTESPDEQLTDIPYPSLHSFPPPVGKQCQHFKDVTKMMPVCIIVLILIFSVTSSK